MHPLYIILALVPISVAFRYCLEETQAARFIGIALASPNYLRINKNGFQDAVSIPEANKWFFLCLGLFVGGLVWLTAGYGWLWGLAGLFAAILSSSVAQVLFLPKKNSRHFCMRFFASMSRRFADFERDGDKERAKAMKHFLDLFAVRFAPTMLTAETETSSPERIISKADADYIFSLDRAGWESYAERMVHPAGWKVQLSRHDTGTGVVALDSATGIGLSTQPFYPDATKPPEMLIVGSYYPVGKLGALTPKRKAELEQAAQADLGSGYTVSVSYFSQPPVLEGIELHVMQSSTST